VYFGVSVGQAQRVLVRHRQLVQPALEPVRGLLGPVLPLALEPAEQQGLRGHVGGRAVAFYFLLFFISFPNDESKA
jgi:hypothetical protein